MRPFWIQVNKRQFIYIYSNQICIVRQISLKFNPAKKNHRIDKINAMEKRRVVMKPRLMRNLKIF